MPMLPNLLTLEVSACHSAVMESTMRCQPRQAKATFVPALLTFEVCP